MNNNKLDALFTGLTSMPTDVQEEQREETPATPKPEKTRNKGNKKRAKAGTEESTEDRFTTIVDKEVLKKIRLIATREGLNVKDVVGAAFEKAIRNYERKHGTLQETRRDTKDLF